MHNLENIYKKQLNFHSLHQERLRPVFHFFKIFGLLMRHEPLIRKTVQEKHQKLKEWNQKNQNYISVLKLSQKRKDQDLGAKRDHIHAVQGHHRLFTFLQMKVYQTEIVELKLSMRMN